MNRPRGFAGRMETWIGALVLIAAVGLAYSLMAGSPAEDARRRFRELLRAIDGMHYAEIAACLDPAFDGKRISGAWPRQARPLLRRFKPEEEALRSLLEPLALKLRLRSARADENEDGSIAVSAVLQLRGIELDGVGSAGLAEEISRRRPELQVVTTWRDLDGAPRLQSIELVSLGFEVGAQ